jgi:hypothetical protein
MLHLSGQMLQDFVANLLKGKAKYSQAAKGQKNLQIQIKNADDKPMVRSKH